MNMIERLENGEYENKTPYPTKPKRPAKAGTPAGKMTGEELRAMADEIEAWNKADEAYREALKEYNRETGRKMESFRADALKELGLEGHPKADKAWAMAWERGHSSGLISVYQELDEIADLIL